MAEQQHFTGIERLPDGLVPELIVRADDGTAAEFDGYRVERGESVFTEVKGNQSIWYKFHGWSIERLAQKDSQVLLKMQDQMNRQLAVIEKLGGGRLEWVVTDPRFAKFVEVYVDENDLPVDVFIRTMPD
ncbi:hypothetical protein [Curtobacterium sp. Leaf261]|uniref:hypothetical protein n=1 Tax=Curtobacterium sp. Leaf261 TaxID=1736311 RepID=UPI0006FDDA36|nr:hypothetical protein [Curtobacterium sp. Leaf261]KQO64931.1 hypothetical protein ASF23_01845 [Curtobacterium sp. Leaf261]